MEKSGEGVSPETVEFYGMNSSLPPRAVSPAPTFGLTASIPALHRVRIVLTRTSHPGNIGAAARAMKTMGLSQLWLVAPRCVVDEHSIALASGASDVLASARTVGMLREALAGTTTALALTARRRELAIEPRWARPAVMELAACLLADSEERDVALVFGNETFGLDNEELAQCGHWALIPANPEYSSLNLAAAVQVLCYEMRLALLDPGAPPEVPDAGTLASLDEVEGLIGQLQDAAVETGFLDPASPKRLMPRLRRLFGRARLEREEINILRGLVAALQRTKKVE